MLSIGLRDRYSSVGRSVNFQCPSPSSAPAVRRFANYAMERAREVRLIAHAAPERNRAEGLGRRQHQSLGYLDAPAQHIVARRNTKRALERTAEVACAEVQQPREISNGNLSGQVGFHVCEDPARLPRRETSACDVRL